MPFAAPRILLSGGEARSIDLGGFGTVFRLSAQDTGGAFALVEHPLAPRTLAAPVHTHTLEDEYSYILEGEVGVEIGGRTAIARPGDVVCKPRQVPHTFWNAGDTPARVLELITPAGFEAYFFKLGEIVKPGEPPDFERLAAHWREYRLEMDLSSIERLCRQHNLRFG